MLSDEEKEEYIEHEILDRLYCLEENDFDKNKVDDGYIKAVLNACKEAKNLIKKQSKEIEELKEKNKFLNWYFENQKDNFVHKDKIKAKIEEYEKALNILLQKYEWIEPSDTIIRNKFMHYIEFGQSLLEKE